MDNQFRSAGQKPSTNSSDDNLIHPGSPPNAYQPVPQPAEPVSQPAEATTDTSSDQQAQTSTASNPTPAGEPLVRQEAATSPAPAKPKKKRNTKKLLLTVFALLLIGGGGVLAYFFVFNKSESAQPAATPQPAAQEVIPLAKDSIFYQAGQKIVKYDTKKKEKIELTDKLPADAEIMDFYTEGETWRAYAQTVDNDSVKIYYLENGKELQEIYSKKRFIVAAADAKSKLVAYTDVFDNNTEANAEKVNKHYLLKADGNTVLLGESELADVSQVGQARNDLKQLKWGVGDISPDGKKIIFHFIPWNSDGRIEGNLEYDINSKNTRLVSSEGVARYDHQGELILEKTNMRGLGSFDAQTPLQLTLSKEIENGKFDDTLVVSNSEWASLAYQNPGSYFASYKRGPRYTQDGSSVFDGFYQTIKPNEFKKVEIKNLPPTNEYAVSEIGKASEQADMQCFGVLLINNSATVQQDVPATYKIGKVCSDENQALAYEEVETVTVPANTTQSLKFL